MKLVFAHPSMVSADLLENGTSVPGVRFFGIERYGDMGIIDIILEFIQSILA